MSVHWGGRGAGHISRWSASTTGVPALVLDFLTTTSLDSRITFTRASTATFVGSNGLIQTAAIDNPRFDYDPVTLAAKGLLIEQQRTNLVTYSEQFDNAAWATGDGGAAVVTSNTTTAPSGVNVADTLNDNSGVAVLGRKNGAVVVSGTGTYTASIFVKNSTSNCASIRLSLAGGTAVIGELVLDTVNGAAQWRTGVSGTSFSVTSFGNGWFRFSATITDNGTGNNVVALEVRPAFASTYSPTINAAATGAIFVYGAQLEAGAFATSYIPTVASQVTRSADTASMTGTNFSDWYNQSEGTFVASFQNVVDTVGGGKAVFSANDGTNNNRIAMITTSALVEGRIVVGGVATNPAQRAITPNAVAKSAIGAAAGNAVQFTNGVLNSQVTPSSLPTVNRLEIGANLASTFLNGHIRQISYYNTRLLDSQLQTLTQ
jgi:hypothetical protein